jgi:RES domain-containing protein
MKLYRIVKQTYVDDLSGEGARIYGGRWNHKGVPALYTSESIALAAMEVLVHLNPADLPTDLQLVTIHLPDDSAMEVIMPEELPEGWRRYPPPGKLTEQGTLWLKKREKLLLRVPSAVIPREWNVLLNPHHPEFKTVKILTIEPFGFDKQLIKVPGRMES